MSERTVYRVRLVIDGEDEAVELHRSARAAGYAGALLARRFPDGHVVFEGIDVRDPAGCPDGDDPLPPARASHQDARGPNRR